MMGFFPSMDEAGRDLIDRGRPGLPHRHPELVEDQIDGLRDAVFSEGAEAPHIGPADPDRIGAQRQRLEDVRAAADAAVDEHRHPAPDRADDLGQRVDRRPHTVHRPAAVIGDEDPVRAVLNRLLGALGRHDALQDELHVAGVLEALDVVPGVGNARAGRTLQPGPHRPHVVRPVLVAVLAEHRFVALAGQRASLQFAIAAAQQVDGPHQGGAPRAGDAVDDPLVHVPVGHGVDLEPVRLAAGLGDLGV